MAESLLGGCSPHGCYFFQCMEFAFSLVLSMFSFKPWKKELCVYRSGFMGAVVNIHS